MASEQQTRNRGSLFENADKRKPSQPDLRGDCTIEGAPYEIQAWRREEQLSLTLAPARVGQNVQNKVPADAFRGALDPAPKASARAPKDEAPLWTGDIVGEELSYAVRAFQKQGKSGPYLTLLFEPVAKPPV